MERVTALRLPQITGLKIPSRTIGDASIEAVGRHQARDHFPCPLGSIPSSRAALHESVFDVTREPGRISTQDSARFSYMIATYPTRILEVRRLPTGELRLGDLTLVPVGVLHPKADPVLRHTPPRPLSRPAARGVLDSIGHGHFVVEAETLSLGLVEPDWNDNPRRER
jgi:hypothetical protein